MHIPTDMVHLIQQIIDLRAMSATPLTKNDDCTEEAIIAAADWMEEQKKAAVKSPTKSPIKKKRKKSAYQCFCSATLNTMRASEPERLAKLEENKELWKYLGAEWQKTKLDDVAFRFYTDQANHINYQASVGFGDGEQVGTEESKEAEPKVPQSWNELEKQWLKDEGLCMDEDETPEDHVEVEKVLAHFWPPNGQLRYLIKFVGTKKPEWVDEEHCACDELKEAYWERKGKKEVKKEEEVVVEDETPEDHVEVEKVISASHLRRHHPKQHYLIKFVGTKNAQWVDWKHCACDELIAEYWEGKLAAALKGTY
tara:strand:- start:51 stop:983 length:933 start_codon:yes stop_codon:yes gene_type:complete